MDDSFRGILKHLEFHGPGPDDIRLVVISIIMYIVLIVATVLIHTYLRRRRERRALLKSAKSRGLTSGELALVVTLAGKQSKVDLRKVFQSIREFHRLFGPKMHDLVAASEHDENAKKMLDGVFSLRKKLFGDVSYHFGSLTSTIQLRIGLKITVQLEYKGIAHNFNSVVLDVDSEAITIANSSFKGSYFMLDKDHPVKISFNRPEDGYYEFDTSVMRTVSSENKFFLLLAHADKIRRMQSRMYYRISARIEVELSRFAWNPDPEHRYHSGKVEAGEKMKGMVVNLGGGGVLIRTGGNLHKNDLVSFDLPLSDEEVLSDVLAKVVDIEDIQGDEEMKNVHVQFLNLKAADKDQIIKDIQQRKLTEAE